MCNIGVPVCALIMNRSFVAAVMGSYSTLVIETTTDTKVCVHVSAFCCSYISQACAVVYCSVYQPSLSLNMLFEACLFLSNSFSRYYLVFIHVQ